MQICDAMMESLILMRGECDRRRGEAVRRWAVNDGVAKPVQRLSGNRVRVFGQRKKRDCGCIDVRSQSGSENNPIAGVPSALRTGSVAQHLRAQLNSIHRRFTPTTEERLFEGDERKSRWNDPTDRARKPRPSVLVRIELHGAIHRSEFPFPKPMTFAAFIIEEPAYRLLER